MRETADKELPPPAARHSFWRLWYNGLLTDEELEIAMSLRTYVPALRLVLYTAHKYATKYQAQLSANLTAPQYTCLVSTIAALADCLALLGPAHIDP